MGENPLTERDRGLTAALVPALASEPPAPFRVRRFQPLPTLSYGEADQHIGGPVERGFGDHVDQTNHSVVVAEKVVVKWMTPPVPLPHPTPTIFAHLVDAGFNDTAPPYAALTRSDGESELLLALVTGYLPDATDGWEWCVDACSNGDITFAAALGRLAANLHKALATLPPEPPQTTPPPSQAPLPPGHTSGQGGSSSGPAAGSGGLLERARAALEEALDLTGGADGAWLASRAGRMRDELAPLAGAAAGPRIRIHGDLHVGQILRWRDGYAVIDFDGNPTVADATPYQPPARDVAQLTTSLEHVAQVAIRRRGTPPADAAAWAARARAEMLDAYTGACDLLDASLIRPFEVEQECRELIYAARHLPRWRYAPMGVLHTWYEKDEDPT
ncbi:phosphotransferase [Nonomuraea typhae]|uniref:phosphotransferase n=1 Tax=Nonomuraea typhae TaxID=2603600 RepID=UPI001CA525D5|nr:phosphotransferase [Nonomuraea typhae]